MTEVTSPADHKSIVLNRIIGKVKGHKSGPTMVFFGGIHGNETAGVFGLNQVFSTLEAKDISGNMYAITGNMAALKENKRYLNNDLNRLWFESRIAEIQNQTILNSEERELLELFQIIQDILETESGPFYFIDFHTTSSKTLPFITINDALINRKFSMLFPVPIVLGIEEYLEGPLLSYINELGYVSLGFESGQHDEKDAVSNCEAFIYLSLVYAKAIPPNSLINFPVYYRQLQEQSLFMKEAFEVVYLHRVKPEDNFNMVPGFKSFEKITKQTELAQDKKGIISSKYNARIFMPLYQSMGEEGFFIIQSIKPFILKLSEFLRRIKFDNILVILPGVSWQDKKKNVLLVNLKVAIFFAKSFFHLLGYRSQKIDSTYLRLSNREHASKNGMYKTESWY